ncbi:MAG: ABC-F family ATP-binding cassette domain-containing protein [Syntrophomonadaceae bacterium]
MIVIQAAGVDKSLGGRSILHKVDFVLQKGEKVGLVGANGAGKSTLLKCLDGTLQPDAGQISKAQFLSVGCLEQVNTEDQGLTLWDFIMEAFSEILTMRQSMASLEEQMKQPGQDLERLLGRYARLQEEYEQARGYACETNARRILSGLGFNSAQFSQLVESFSGGQKTRIKLARLLAASPDCLLLDEPTNHLDTGSVEWLEDYLSSYPGTLLVVSHDRMLLERVATRIIEVRNGRLYSFPGNYSNYLKQRAVQDLAWERAYERQQEYIRKTEGFITRYKAGVKARQARGREAQLSRLERLEQPQDDQVLSAWPLPQVPPSGEDVLEVEGISKGFDNVELLGGVNAKIRRGDKVALIGPNGSGKTTFLRILQGLEPAQTGQIRWGSRVRAAYFAQESENLNPENTLLEEIYNNFALTLEQARTYLGSILFSGDDVFKKVNSLSGGERGRLALLKALLSKPNFLILDEPTNHLDIHGRLAAEDLLAGFPGTILMVSHDRYFIDQVCNRVLAIENQSLVPYGGNYTYYREKQARVEELSDSNRPRREKPKNPAGSRQTPSRFTLNRHIDELEMQIREWEEEKKAWEQKFYDAEFLASGEAARLGAETFGNLEEKLRLAYEEWETFSLMLEALDEKAD